MDDLDDEDERIGRLVLIDKAGTLVMSVDFRYQKLGVRFDFFSNHLADGGPMRRFHIHTLLSLFVVLLLALIAFSTVHASNRVALVIGNGRYKMNPLKNPANDAEDVSAALEGLGFKVTKVLNADRRKMTQAVSQFGERLRKGGIGLFYYAGHGLQMDGINYLLPVDANIHTEPDIPFESIDANRVLAHMDAANNELNIAIFDACRNNPYARSFRNSKNGFAHMDPPRGSLVVFATGPNNVAVDGEGRNGTFTKNFLKYIKQKNLELGMLMRKVRADVETETGGIQSPYEVSNVKGAFYFAVDSTPTQTQPAQTALLASLPPEPKRIKSLDGELEAISKWKAWQKMMGEEFEKIQTYDKSALSAAQKLEAWQSFMDYYGADNPYSIDDDKMQNAAKSRLAYWKSQQELPKSAEKVKVASNTPEVTQPKIVAPNRQYEKLANGIVYEKNSGLEWYVGPDRGTEWTTAKEWVGKLAVDGGGWRMPTVKELEGLYEKGTGDRNMTPLLKTKGWLVWSGEKAGSSSAKYFNFLGSTWWRFLNDSDYYRGFAVRSRKGPQTIIETGIPEFSDKTPVASVSPQVTVPKIVATDRHFQKLANGIVFDRNTSLEWFAGPDKASSFENAKSWANDLKIDGDKSWRMPSIKELKTLYQKGLGTRNITPYLQMSSCNVWSADGSIWSREVPCFDFCTGTVVNLSKDIRHYDYFRGLAVRSRKYYSPD